MKPGPTADGSGICSPKWHTGGQRVERMQGIGYQGRGRIGRGGSGPGAI